MLSVYMTYMIITILSSPKLAKQAKNLENVCGRPCQLIWKIAGFKKKMEQAKSDKDSVIFSPPFYTHNKGYKMGLSLCLNGDGSGLVISLLVS